MNANLHTHYNYLELEEFSTSDIKISVFLYLNTGYMPHIQNTKVNKFLVMHIIDESEVHMLSILVSRPILKIFITLYSLVTS